MEEINAPFAAPASTPSFVNQPGNKKNMNKSVVIVTIIVLVLFGIFIFSRQGNSSKQTEKITPTSGQVETPTPTPNVDKKTVKIQVLNGTGTPGQASSAVKALVTAGFSAENIKTGNADTYDHTSTSIAAKDGYSGVASDIKSALASTFDNVTVDSTTLPSSNEYDIVVTTGGKIYVTNTPTPGPTTSVTPTVTPTTTLTPTPTPTPTTTP